MHRSGGGTMRRAAARWARRAAAFAFAAVASLAVAAPPAGTVITNQASATGQAGTGPLAGTSNTVSFSVAACSNCTYGAVLTANNQLNSAPGATVVVPHTLTNTGSAADSFTLAATPLNTSGWAFTSIAILPDANGDGVADSNTPLGPQALAAGQTLRFVVRYVIPATAALATENTVRLAATGTNSAAAPIGDRIVLPDTSVAMDCGTVSKSLSRASGPSPAGPVTVSAIGAVRVVAPFTPWTVTL